MTVCFYTALEVQSLALQHLGVKNPHITTSFTPVVGKLPKMKSWHFLLPWDACQAKITEVQYWEEPDVTVAVVTAPSALAHYQRMMDLGFVYELEYIPHITLCKGRGVDKYASLLGTYCDIIDVYCGHIIKSNATSDVAAPPVGNKDNYPSDKLFKYVPSTEVQDVPSYNYGWKDGKTKTEK